jgi:hypothetical protein
MVLIPKPIVRGAGSTLSPGSDMGSLDSDLFRAEVSIVNPASRHSHRDLDVMIACIRCDAA